MNLKQIESFVKVAEHKNFSRAAKALYLTQPTVSAHISELESEYGIKLFARTTKEVVLTEKGEKLYEMAKQLLEIEEQMEHLFDGEEAFAEQKKLRIAASSIPAQYVLPNLMGQFKQKHPHVKFEITEGDSKKVADAVESHSVDLGLTGSVMERKFCKYTPICKDDLIIIAPNDEHFNEIKENAKDISWVKKESFIMREEGSGTRSEAEKLFIKSEIPVSDLNVVANIDSTEAIKRSVISGVGIAVVSRMAVLSELEKQLFLEFPLSNRNSRRNLNIVYNNSYPMSKLAESFLKMAKNYGLQYIEY